MTQYFVIQPESRLYKLALKREIGFWRYINSFKQNDLLDEVFHPVQVKYNGKTYHFERNKDWVEFISQFGPFQKALILGGNQTDLEKHLIQNEIVGDFENLDVIHSGSSSSMKFADLNFIELEPESYDIIIAKSILHHIINLEHLLLQVNKALKENGIFVVFEYVGENKSQWEQNKIDTINSHFERHKLVENYSFDSLSLNYNNEDPFEQIRSEDILPLLNKIFPNTQIVGISWDKVVWPTKYHLMHYTQKNHIIIDKKYNEKILKSIDNLEIECSNNNKLLACLHFGVYRKNTNPPQLVVKKWSKSKIKLELALHGPIIGRLRSIMVTNHQTKLVRFILSVKKMIFGRKPLQNIQM